MKSGSFISNKCRVYRGIEKPILFFHYLANFPVQCLDSADVLLSIPASQPSNIQT